MMDTSGENIFNGGEDSQSSQNIEVINWKDSEKYFDIVWGQTCPI